MKCVKEGLADEAGLLSEESVNVSHLEELNLCIRSDVESIKVEILEEVSLLVKENYRLAVLDDKVNSLRSEVDSIRGDIFQLRSDFEQQIVMLFRLIEDLPNKINKNGQE